MVASAEWRRDEYQDEYAGGRVPSQSSKRNTSIRKRWYFAVAAVSAVALGGGCSGSGNDHAPESPTAKPGLTVPEAQLRTEALAKLSPSAHITMHGTKNAKGGLPETEIHTPDKQPYVFEAACAGSGGMNFNWVTKTGHTGPLQTLICGEGLLAYRFIGGDLISVDLQTAKATGVLAWQVIPWMH
jgi:hypothetical protein